MSSLKLVDKSSDILRQVAQPVLENELDQIKEFTREMTEIMLQSNGIGLAAPQVGISKKFFIWGTKENIKTVINPEIISTGGEKVPMIEGCLSFPGEHYAVVRPDKVTISYYDINWNKKTEDLVGFISRVYQHETDHLNGICIDKIGEKKDIDVR
jgi:peptide deformylase